VAFVDLNAAQLTGRQPPPLQEVESGRWLQPAVAAAYLAMKSAAQQDGINLQIASGWRDFARQHSIVAAKLRGERPVFDLMQQQLELSALPFSQKLHAVLLYSALPGASRHHWGTDLDVFDQAAITADYQLQLSPSEYADGGPFAPLSDWLAKHAAAFGFFRPYLSYRGGVATEPWHLSYRPFAECYLAQLSVELLEAALRDPAAGTALPELDQLCTMLPDLWQRFIINIDGENYDH